MSGLGMRSWKTLMEIALLPAGQTLYVWGGGWNAEDTGAGETALHSGLWEGWRNFFLENCRGYSFLTGKYNWEHGKRCQRFWGLDCSGYMGWLLFNWFHTPEINDLLYTDRKVHAKLTSYTKTDLRMRKDDETCDEGWVFPATHYAEILAEKKFGILSRCTPESDFEPGDIVSIQGHVFLCLKQYPDGSVLLMHSSPNGGVQMSGTSKLQNTIQSYTYRPIGCGISTCKKKVETVSMASRMAEYYMKKHSPLWWECFGKEEKQILDASVYLNGQKFTWKNSR